MQSHLINDLYGESYDFKDAPSHPASRLMISAIPRSGSTLLGIKLWQTGICGAPMEYLNLVNRKNDMIKRLGNGDAVTYWNRLLKLRTSPNGVFAFKIFIGDYDQVLKDCPSLLPYIGSDWTIYLTRRDKLRQAVSYARAFQSGKWFSIASETAPPTYERKNIDHALYWIRSAEEGWEAVFARKSCNPIRVYYEDLQDDPDATIRDILLKLGLPAPVPLFPFAVPDIAIQRDELNEVWRARYLAEMDHEAA